jgi:hypothetical protein
MKKNASQILIIALALAIAVPQLGGKAFARQLPADYSRPEQNEPPAQAAPAYTPKYHGDPARSDSEFAALAYMRVVMRAQMLYNKKNGHYATSLSQLVHTGTFTQRMVNSDRGDYTVGFKSKKDNYVLTMTPKNLDPQHRSFYAEDDGKIHADETKAADGDSTVVETHHW